MAPAVSSALRRIVAKILQAVENGFILLPRNDSIHHPLKRCCEAKRFARATSPPCGKIVQSRQP
jgi:hypothetical protein